MATLAELLKEYNLDGDSEAQTKTASPVATSNEVNQVLEALNLAGTNESMDKIANSNEQKGDRMSLTGIYEELFGDTAPVAGQEKTASEVNAEEVNEATELFGELTAHYFEAAQSSFMDKLAASVESHLDQDEEAPLAGMDNESQLGKTMGKIKEPHMAVNHAASKGHHMVAATGNTSPYSLKEMALKKQILKGMAAAPVGDIKD